VDLEGGVVVRHAAASITEGSGVAGRVTRLRGEGADAPLPPLRHEAATDRDGVGGGRLPLRHHLEVPELQARGRLEESALARERLKPLRSLLGVDLAALEKVEHASALLGGLGGELVAEGE